ncbi:unnamed protein product [Sphagnum troendelagicum]
MRGGRTRWDDKLAAAKTEELERRQIIQVIDEALQQGQDVHTVALASVTVIFFRALDWMANGGGIEALLLDSCGHLLSPEYRESGSHKSSYLWDSWFSGRDQTLDIQQLNSIFKGLSYKRMQFLKLDETFRTDYHVIIILNAGFLSIAVKGDL